MYHIFFNHSSDNGHLGFLHVLAIINSAAMNIGVHVSFLLEFSTDVYLGRELVDHMVTLFSVFFLRNLLLFSIEAALIYISTNSVGRFPFLHTLSS